MVTVIWSSPNEGGLTAAAARQIAQGLDDAGCAAGLIRLNAARLEHCRACGTGWGLCALQGRCVLQDDFSGLYEKLCASEGIVFVTAVYWHDMTEQFKAFLDRLRRCETRKNHALSGKSCLIAACAGGTGRGAVTCLERFEDSLGHMGMKAVDRLPVVQFNRAYMLPALRAAGRTFGDYLQGKALFPNLP